MWFALEGLSDGELEDIAAELVTLDDILAAELPSSVVTFLPSTNLIVTFDDGASPGESTAIAYDFGQGVTLTAFAVPEPTTLTLAALGLIGCAVRWRRGRR